MNVLAVSSVTATAWAVAVGASSTGLMTTVNDPDPLLATAVSTPPLSTPPSSLTDTVSVAVPVALAAGTKLNVPFSEIVGASANKLAPPVLSVTT